jgi:hypothetical protein
MCILLSEYYLKSRKGGGSMKRIVGHPEIPLGFGMALMQDIDAYNFFSNLSEEQQWRIIERTHGISSKKEMQDFVGNLPRFL